MKTVYSIFLQGGGNFQAFYSVNTALFNTLSTYYLPGAGTLLDSMWYYFIVSTVYNVTIQYTL